MPAYQDGERMAIGYLLFKRRTRSFERVLLLYRGYALDFALAEDPEICCRADVSFAAFPKGDHMEMGISRRQQRI